MELKDFIEKFADQFDDTDASMIKAETAFRDLDEWSSLVGLAVFLFLIYKIFNIILIRKKLNFF